MQEACTMTICATVGIDVSKDRLDVVLRREEHEQTRGCANTAAGFLELHRWLGGQDVQPQQTRVVLEATGSYSDAIALFLYEHDYRRECAQPGGAGGLSPQCERAQQDRCPGCASAGSLRPGTASTGLEATA